MVISAEIAVFLNGLTVDSIDRAIRDFKEGIKSRMVLPADFDPGRAQIACSRILRLTEKRSTAMNNIYDVPKFWINLDGLVHSSNLNVIESYITRAYCMQGALNFHLWLIDVVQHAVSSPLKAHHQTWIEKLAWDVAIAADLKQTVTFDSAKYLPGLTIHKIYTYKPGPFRYSQKETVSNTLSSILKLWLHFPSDEDSFLQLSLIRIVAFNSPSSVLFLDKIWEMYTMPFSTVFDVWNGRISQENINKSLTQFQQQYKSHPFATADSLEHNKLEYLSKLIADWVGINGLASDMPTMVSRCQKSSMLSSN